MNTATHHPHDAIALCDVTPKTLRLACSECNLRELCLPLGLSEQDMERIDGLVQKRVRVRKGQLLFRQGDRFSALYAIRSGFLKTRTAAADGKDQVTGFHMAGEIVGMDGVTGDQHACDAIALEDSELCELPFGSLETLSREVTALQRHVHRIMSREIVRENDLLLLLGHARAEERMASFLLNLLQRHRARGFSSSELVLRMTREEIGSYLGLTLETVSRSLSRLASQGVIQVRQKHLKILDATRLHLT
ncbi:MAG: hypothetical protein RLZZ126_815 [Pseudomonadota bacterium]|jgi:CRP/FNR family transcriptional regulator, anaerobic regulatory protein